MNANYRFLMIEVGAFGKDSDTEVFSISAIYHNIENSTLVIPKYKQIHNSYGSTCSKVFQL